MWIEFLGLHPIRVKIKRDVFLTLLPTLLVLGALGVAEAFTHERLIFSSLASSVFLIYSRPGHQLRSLRTALFTQASAAPLGLGANGLIGPGYMAAGIAMILMTILVISARELHPPAISTALILSFRANLAESFAVFGIMLLSIAVSVLLQQAVVKIVLYYYRNRSLASDRLP